MKRGIFAWVFILGSALKAQTFCSGGCPANTAIPDGGCPTQVTSTINVSGVGTIDNTYGLVRVCVYITHTWRADIELQLVAPDGTTIQLANDNGSSGDDFGAGCTTTQMLCFDMNATSSISNWASTDPATGSYVPLQCLSAVNNGQNADGTWTLQVCDDATGDVGQIEGWCLEFGPNPPPCPVAISCPTGDDCASAYALTPPSGILNFDIGACNGDYDASCTSACGQDIVFQIDVPDGYQLKWWVSNDNFDVVGYTYINGCPGTGTEITCSDNDAFVHSWCNTTGTTQTAYIVVDEWGSSTCNDPGTGQLNWELTPITTSADYSFTAPFTHSSTTCGAGNDITDNACNTSYDGGEDVIYAITFPTAGTYQITVTNTDGTNYIGWFLTSSLPCGSISSCIAYAVSGSNSVADGCVTISTPGTYYLVIDYFPSPTCSNYDISVQPISADFSFNAPFTHSSTTCGAGNDITSNSCNITYDGGEDVVYAITFSTAGDYRISVTNTDGTNYIGWFLTSNMVCSSISSCIAYTISDTTNLAERCVTITTPGTYYLTIDYGSSVTCSNYDISVQPISGVSSACSMNYAITSIAYQAPPLGYLSGTSLKGTFDDPDDEYSNQSVPLPFSFCFDGNWYDSLLVADNGYVIFPVPCKSDHAPINTGGDAVLGGFSPWNHDPAITWPCNNVNECGPFNTIALLWRDNRLNGEGTDSTSNQNWDIRYYTTGTAPNRRFYITFYEIPHYGSQCRENPQYNLTGYIMLEETSYAIEIHILQSDTCLSWDDGLGIVGLHSIDGQFAAVPAGYNNTAVPINNKAWRFTPPANCCSTPLAIIANLHIQAYCEQGKTYLNISPTQSPSDNYWIELQSNAYTKTFSLHNTKTLLWEGDFPINATIYTPQGEQWNTIIEKPNCAQSKPIVVIKNQQLYIQLFNTKGLLRFYDLAGKQIAEYSLDAYENIVAIPSVVSPLQIVLLLNDGSQYHYILMRYGNDWRLGTY